MSISSTAIYPGTERRRRQAPSSAGKTVRTWPAAPVTILLISLVIPWVFSFGSMAVSIYRLVLLAVTVPALFMWLSGRAGRIRMADILLGLFCIWCAIAIAMVHGPAAAIEPGGMLFLETFGAYLMARCYVRRREDLIAVTRLLFVILAVMLPLAVIEATTGERVTTKLFGLVMPTIQTMGTGVRWGLTRVQGPFEHPILFGVFCGGATALTHLLLGGEANIVRRWTMTAIVVATAFLALSSGPMTALLVQLALIGWNWILGAVSARWRILWLIGIFAYCGAELFSNQSVPQLLTRFAFDPWTAYYRLLIWEYGVASVMANPLFGTGFNDWLHPAWMPPSIDMFWLLPAIRHGLPAGLLLFVAFFAAVLAVGLKPCHDQKVLACRTAYLITMTGFFLVGWTVHFWNATFVLFTFLLGSGMWILDVAETEPPAQAGRGARSFQRQSRSTIERLRRQSATPHPANPYIRKEP